MESEMLEDCYKELKETEQFVVVTPKKVFLGGNKATTCALFSDGIKSFVVKMAGNDEEDRYYFLDDVIDVITRLVKLG